MGGPPRRFEIGDSAIPLKGVFRGDVGTVIDTKTIYVRNAKNTEKPVGTTPGTPELDKR